MGFCKSFTPVQYLFVMCLVLQVSGQFEGSIVENHTNEHVDAGLHLLMKKKIILCYEYWEGGLEFTTETCMPKGGLKVPAHQYKG